MSAAKRDARRPNTQLPDPKRNDPRAPVATVHFLPPLRPRRGLFVALLIAFVVWIGFLMVLYFRTVHARSGG